MTMMPCAPVAGLRRAPARAGGPTVKGKGIDFMEDQLMWHYRSLKEGEREAALAALEAGAA